MAAGELQQAPTWFVIVRNLTKLFRSSGAYQKGGVITRRYPAESTSGLRRRNSRHCTPDGSSGTLQKELCLLVSSISSQAVCARKPRVDPSHKFERVIERLAERVFSCGRWRLVERAPDSMPIPAPAERDRRILGLSLGGTTAYGSKFGRTSAGHAPHSNLRSGSRR
jgi:hypothetical protein